MVIKDTHKLVERAEWHAEQDHIYQGTYGAGKVNGETEFKGCAIGCLATPHGDEELAEFLRRYLREDLTASPSIWGEGMTFLGLDSIEQTYEIEEQFGICTELLRVVEDIFEGLPTHGDAINFLPAFARALPEGADIKGADVMERIHPPLHNRTYEEQPRVLFDVLAEFAPVAA